MNSASQTTSGARKGLIFSLCLLVSTLSSAAAFSQEPVASQPTAPVPPPAPPPSQSGFQPRIDVGAELNNFFLFRNDSDFDRTRPIYNENGQSVGAFATVFRPKITFHSSPHLRLYYEAELGMNFWSKNNPDQQDALAPDVFVMKHRQVYSEGDMLDGKAGFRVGYQYFQDPTALFIGHWMGAANAWYSWQREQKVSLFVGQLPDQTYEGINVSDNNFRRDIFVFGPRADIGLGSNRSLSASVIGLYDSHLVHHTKWLVAPTLHLEGKAGSVSGFLDGVLQVGKIQGAALGGEDQKVFAWAAQAHGSWNSTRASVDVNGLVLSSDDAKDGNRNQGTFQYSSRSRSATLILTEDEHRNWYDQLDRRLGTYQGGFWQHRAGLAVADVKGTWHASRVFHPALILGAASVLQSNNALGHRFVGVETDLDLEFRASDTLSAFLTGGALIPGGAGGALLNRIDMGATEAIYMAEASLMARY